MYWFHIHFVHFHMKSYEFKCIQEGPMTAQTLLHDLEKLKKANFVFRHQKSENTKLKLNLFENLLQNEGHFESKKLLRLFIFLNGY